MPIKESAKKALRQAEKHYVLNSRRKEAVKNSIKKIKKLVALGKKDEAKSLVAQVYQTIDKAAKTGVLKKNTAARRKAGIMKLLK